jgi:hypothetical protein
MNAEVIAVERHSNMIDASHAARNCSQLLLRLLIIGLMVLIKALFYNLGQVTDFM